MGLFNKIKNMFKGYDEEETKEESLDAEIEDVEEDDLEESSEEDADEIRNDDSLEDKEETETIVENHKKGKNRLFFKKKDKKEEEKKAVKVYEKGLSKSREGFVSKLANLTNKYKKITDEYFDELEEILIMADIGVNTVMDFMDRLRDRVRTESITDPSVLKEIIVDELFIIYVNDEVISNKINYREDGPTVVLFIGVNGVGKTTTIAKLANKMIDEGKKVLMVGADTFRAGAVEQLREWSERVKAGFYGKEESDPASVVYDGIELEIYGKSRNEYETLLVIDATTGQNGISQAKAFQEITNITGIVLTKLDGTAKGGIVLAIKESVGIPVKYIGLGETKDDLQVFDIEKYIYGLFKDMM